MAENEGELAKIVSDLYRELSGEFATQSVIKELRKGIAYVKNMMLGKEDLGELDTGFDQFPELYVQYNLALRQRRWMDYDDQMIYAVLAETKPNQQEQLKFKREELRKYFPSGYTEEQMRRDIIKGLELLKRQRERNRDAR